MNRCPNCTSELIQNKCSSCGYPSVNVIAVRNALPCKTVLLNRFELGNPLGHSVQSISYIAYDTQANSPVIVLEFYPRQIVSRKDNEVVVRRNRDLYMNAVQQYLTSTQAHPLQLLATFAENNTAYRVYCLSNHCAMAAKDAELLLDMPILFHNEDNKPTMSINALVIPPMPQRRQWKPTEKIVKEQHRHQVNRYITFAVVFLVFLLGGIIAYDAIREHDVVVQVKTSAPIVQARLGEIELPAASPNEEGIVTYQTKARKGEYIFEAFNELNMHSEAHMLLVPTIAPHQVSIPTPSPSPVPPIQLLADEWIFQQNGQYYISSNPSVPVLALPGNDTPMADILIAGSSHSTSSTSCDLILRRDNSSFDLDWQNNASNFSVSLGEYTLLLRCNDSDYEIASFSADQSKTINLDTDAIAFYHEYLCRTDDTQRLYYVGDHASMLLDGTDASGINAWADKYPALFEAYRQYPVAFQLDDRLPTDVHVTINDLTWHPGEIVTICKDQSNVTITIAANDTTYSETAEVDLSSNAPIIIGQKYANAIADRWSGLTGLIEINGQFFAVAGDKPQSIDTTELNELSQAMAFAPKAFSFAANSLRKTNIIIDSSIRPSQIKDVTINGLLLTNEDGSQQYSFAASPGSYSLCVSFLNGIPSFTEPIHLSSNSPSSVSVMKKEVEGMIKLRNALQKEGVNKIAVLNNQYAFIPPLNSDSELTLSALDAVLYSQVFDIFSGYSIFNIAPVNVSIDNRFNPEAIQEITLEGQPLEQEQVASFTEASEGIYNFSVVLTDGSPHKYSLSVSSENDNTLTLLSNVADEAFSQLRFWGARPDSLEVQNPSPVLQQSYIHEQQLQAKAYQLRVSVPAEQGASPLYIKYKDSTNARPLTVVEVEHAPESSPPPEEKKWNISNTTIDVGEDDPAQVIFAICSALKDLDAINGDPSKQAEHASKEEGGLRDELWKALQDVKAKEEGFSSEEYFTFLDYQHLLDLAAQANGTDQTEVPVEEEEPVLFEVYVTGGSYELYLIHEEQPYVLWTHEITQDQVVDLSSSDFPAPLQPAVESTDESAPATSETPANSAVPTPSVEPASGSLAASVQADSDDAPQEAGTIPQPENP